jgi:hypothetical protein
MPTLHNWGDLVRRPDEIAPYLRQNHRGFSGDYEVAASRLGSLVSGVEWVMTRLQQRGLAVAYPEVITIPFVADKDVPIGVMSHPGAARREVWVEIPHLEQIASFDPDIALEAEREHWSVELGLTGDQLFHNIGVEEGHHAASSSVEPTSTERRSAVGEGTDLWISYYSEYAEYTAMQWRLESLRERGQSLAYGRMKQLLDAVDRYREVNGPSGQRWPDAALKAFGLREGPARPAPSNTHGPRGNGNPTQLA